MLACLFEPICLRLGVCASRLRLISAGVTLTPESFQAYVQFYALIYCMNLLNQDLSPYSSSQADLQKRGLG